MLPVLVLFSLVFIILWQICCIMQWNCACPIILCTGAY